MHVTRNHLSSHLGIVLQPWIISSQSKYLTKICSRKKTSSEDILKVLWRSNSVKLQVCLRLRIQTTSERTTSLNLQHKSLLLQRHCFLQLVKCSKALASCVSILVPPNHFNLQASNTLHVSQSILASTISNPKFQNWTLTNQCTSTLPSSTHHGPDAIVDPFRICPTPKCHVCIWSGGASVGPKPGTTWIFGKGFKGQGQSPGRCKRHPAVRAVHHQSYMVRVGIFLWFLPVFDVQGCMWNNLRSRPVNCNTGTLVSR